MSLRSVGDGSLVARVGKGGDVAFAELARRYGWLIARATRWAPAGLTREDLRQEALIGLFDACRVYDPGRGAFSTIAGACIRYHVIGAHFAATRPKRRILTDALSLDVCSAEGPENVVLGELLPAPEGADPARVVELREELRELAAARRWRAGVPRLGKGRLYSDEQVAQAVGLVREGATLTHAAAAVGASIMTVSRWVRKAA